MILVQGTNENKKENISSYRKQKKKKLNVVNRVRIS